MASGALPSRGTACRAMSRRKSTWSGYAPGTHGARTGHARGQGCEAEAGHAHCEGQGGVAGGAAAAGQRAAAGAGDRLASMTLSAIS